MTNPHKIESSASSHQATPHSEPEDISIVMAVYNHEATVAKALESALMQKMPYTYRIYCMNDASTDNSADILKEYAQRYPDKILVFTSPENQGSGKKSFLCHRPPVKGRYWCLLAGDDYWISKDKLVRQIDFLDQNPNYVGCSCNTVKRNEVTGAEKIIKPFRNTWNLLDWLLHKHPFYVHTSSIIWRNIYLGHGFFLPPNFIKKNVYGDVVLTHMMLCEGGKMHNIPEVMSCYRVTGLGVWSSKSPKEQTRLNKKLLPKMIRRSVPFKYKLFALFHRVFFFSPKIRSMVPGPVNE